MFFLFIFFSLHLGLENVYGATSMITYQFLSSVDSTNESIKSIIHFLFSVFHFKEHLNILTLNFHHSDYITHLLLHFAYLFIKFVIHLFLNFSLKSPKSMVLKSLALMLILFLQTVIFFLPFGVLCISVENSKHIWY